MTKKKSLLFLAVLALPMQIFAAETTGVNAISLNLDDLWVLVAAALVFFMQAGFKVLETGMVKHEHRTGVGAKNLLDWVAGSIAFFLVGFGLMFGYSDNGFFGEGFFAGQDLLQGKQFIFFLFQLAFAGTALTIVSGAMSGRTGVIPYFIASMMTAMVIYPIFGHWAWGNLMIADNQPWLASLGFMDFAGSTVVHSVGAWVALVGIYMVGPRIGRYDAQGRLQPVKASDYSYSILGVMILWLGWWGFNGGSTLAFNEDVAKIILNTNLAGAAACFTAFFHATLFQKKQDVIEKLAGGCLTGLVSITACCNVVDPLSSLLIGGLAGIIHNYFYVILSEKLKLDDPVGAIAVHGVGGVFGTLCVALFGQADLLVHDRGTQLMIQLVGIFACFLFTTSISLVMFYLIKKTIGLRVSPLEEKVGSFVENMSVSDSSTDPADQHVNQIAVRVSSRGYNMYTVSEYLKIDQESRKKFIQGNRIKYMDESGNIMQPLVAVRQLGLMLESEKNNVVAERDQMKSKQEEMEKNTNHASQLQSALLGRPELINDMFEESFVLFKPRVNVSGDFYWFKEVSGFKIIIVANGMVSGVSGAILSMLGLSIINEIFSSNKLHYPEKILDLIDKKFLHALTSKNTDIRLMDSLDISVVIVDELKQKIHFSGANSDIYLVGPARSKEIYGNTCSIGLRELSASNDFERQTIEYLQDESIYMFTDGFYNQFNQLGESYSKHAFLEKINEIYQKDFTTQSNILEKEFSKWIKDGTQTDDVLVIGLKLR